MTQFSLGRSVSMVTSSSSPSESELMISSLGTSFFFLVPFLGATSSPSESESVASSHVPFLGSFIFIIGGEPFTNIGTPTVLEILLLAEGCLALVLALLLVLLGLEALG